MEEQVLRLCKRLRNFTLEDIEPILNIKNLENILQKFVAENALSFQSGKYFYNKEKKGQVRLPLFFQCHAKEVIKVIIQGFSCEIEEYKIMFLAEKSFTVVSKFNKYFRQIIFEQQKNKLLEYYENSPKIPWERKFFEQTFFFYNYGNKVFVSEKKLQSLVESPHSNSEYLEFKRVYSFIKRYTSHNTRKFYPHFYITEAIWRRNKTFEQLKNDLYKLLGCKY